MVLASLTKTLEKTEKGSFQTLAHFPRKFFQLCHSKIWKILKTELLKHSEYSFFSSRYLENHFLRSFLWPTPRKPFQLRHLKIYKKLKNDLFKRWEYSFLSWRKLQNHSLRRFLWQEDGFNFVTQKLAKNWKMPFSNARNSCFCAQGTFKTIF